jgi:hypothetical protein
MTMAGLKSNGPDGFIRQGRVLGGKSKTIPDGGYAKLTRRFYKANGVPILPGTCFSVGKMLKATRKLKAIIHRIQNITQYETEEYIKGKRIVDLEKASLR